MALRNVTVHGPPGAREQEQVEEMLRRHDSFDSIEAFINSTDLHPDVQARSGCSPGPSKAA